MPQLKRLFFLFTPLPTKLRSLTSPHAPVYGLIRFLGFLFHPHFIRKPVVRPGVSQRTNRVVPLSVGCLGLASMSSSQTQSLWGDGLPPGRGTREDILTAPSTATQHTCCISLSGVQHSSPNSVHVWCWPALCKGRTGRRRSISRLPVWFIFINSRFLLFDSIRDHIRVQLLA